MRFYLISKYLVLFKTGLIVTLKFTALSMLLGFALGAVVALIKVSKCRPLQWICNIYTSFCRGVPLMVQLFLIYFATPQLTGYKITPLEAGFFTFGLNGAATISEVLRGGIMAIDRGQTEAAMALGINYYKMMKDIILPQALKSVLPSLVNESIGMLKNSSLISTIGVVDVLRAAQTIQSLTYIAFEPLIICAVIYYILVMLLTIFANFLERRLNGYGA